MWTQNSLHSWGVARPPTQSSTTEWISNKAMKSWYGKKSPNQIGEVAWEIRKVRFLNINIVTVDLEGEQMRKKLLIGSYPKWTKALTYAHCDVQRGMSFWGDSGLKLGQLWPQLLKFIKNSIFSLNGSHFHQRGTWLCYLKYWSWIADHALLKLIINPIK